jgi:hypothetical protein
MTTYNLIFHFINHRSKDLNLALGQRQLKHAESLISVDDFKETSLHVSGQSRLGLSVPAALDVAYKTRSFSESADARKDTVLGIGCGLGWEWSRLLSNDLKVQMIKQKSSRDVSTFNKTEYSLGLNLTL